MSGAGGHGLYGDPTADFNPFHHGDVDSFLFQRSPGSGEGGGRGDGLTPYSSITDYLQGFLDPEGMAAHLDAPCRLGGDVVKQEMVVQVSGHVDGDHQTGVAGAPVTPNSSVLSSSSELGGDGVEEEPRRRCKNGRPKEEEVEIDDDEGSEAHRNCKMSKEKKRGEKKAREPRVAFVTKSEVDHLEDGYRWRKYGQKAVKNSSYPRSYYRCTAARCGVKKLVERSQQDPSTVITTYEGQHTHPSLVRAAGTARALVHPHDGYSPLQLGRFRPDLAARAMMGHIGYAGTPRLPAGLPPPAVHLLQEHRASQQRATCGGVLDLVPSAMDNGIPYMRAQLLRDRGGAQFLIVKP